MKLVKIFGAVMAVHAAVFLFVFAIPGCRSTGKKAAAAKPATESSPVAPVDNSTASPFVAESTPADVAAIRFSPTRPGTSAAAAIESAPAEPAAADYTVVKGDTLWGIAKKTGVSVKQLSAVNNIRSDSPLKLGQKLVIPGKPSAATAPSAGKSAAATSAVAAPAAKASSLTHVVKAGDTLGGIAKKYSVKVGDIATANNIADPTKIRVGQSLKIPGWQQPAAKSAPAAVVTAPATFTPAASVSAPVASESPVVGSPFLDPAPAANESPITVPSSGIQDAPVIRIEESGAPKIE